MSRVAIVCVDDVTSGAARRPIITRMIVCAQKVQRRIEESRLLQSKIDGICSLRGAESTRTQSLVRLARIFVFVRQARFQTPLAAALEDAENIPGLRNLPARQRIEKR